MSQKEKRGMWTKLVLLVWLLGVLCLLPAAATEANRVVRVGFPIQPGMTELDENGDYTGYTVDYLMEIAQYTGWEYEFVTLEGDLDAVLTSLLGMLERGELDLMGGINFSADLAQRYDFPGASYGMVSSCLLVRADNSAINASNVQRVEGLRIGIRSLAERRNAELERFYSTSGMTPVLVPCDTEQELLERLERGEIDALTGLDISPIEGTRVVAKFASRPFYFAAPKGARDIVAQLNSAILKIEESDPYFATTLHQKYFAGERGTFQLTDEEQAYVDRSPAIRVAYGVSQAPIEFQDETGAFAGISREVFDYIAAKTGLRFTYVPVYAPQELTQLLQTGQVDLVAALPGSPAVGVYYGVSLSRAYLVNQMVMAVNSRAGAAAHETRRLVLPEGVEHKGDEAEVIRLPTMEDCIRAVNAGQAEYTYGSSYTIQYCVSRLNCKNVTLLPQAGSQQRMVIGLPRPVDVTLLTLLNRAIRDISDSDLQAMIYRNAVSAPSLTLGAYVEANPVMGAVLTAVPAGLVILLLAVIVWNRHRMVRRQVEQNERYRQLCELSGEYLFEYDRRLDRLVLTEPCAAAFGIAPVWEHYMERLRSGTGPQSQAKEELDRAVSGTHTGTWERAMTIADGSTRWFRVVCKSSMGQNGESCFTMGKLVDIQEEKERLLGLEERAQRDGLTGAYNAAASRQIISRRLEEEERGGALLLLDLDFFKQINDLQGHYTGDQVLIAVAGILTARFRREDVVCRPGGDEFLVYMPGVVSADVVGHKCADLLLDCANLRGGKVSGQSVTLSIGVAMADGCRDYDFLYRRADEALYRVKRQGRNGYAFAPAAEE